MTSIRGKSPGALPGIAVCGAILLVGSAAAQEPISKAKYACADNKTIEASYFPDKVDLMLSDGRTMSLPQATAASGTRYADADESFVFWSKGNTAFATEGDSEEPTYADCVEQQS